MLRHQPSLQTPRLRLRPFVADDAAAVSTLAGAREIAEATISIPHPYSLTAAKTWIASLAHLFRSGAAVNFAVTLLESKKLIGAASLKDIDGANAQAELGFWIGVPWWGHGYGTEVGCEVLRFGFSQLALHRIYSQCLAAHPASGKILLNIGMKRECVLRERIRKGERFEDVAIYAILAGEFSPGREEWKCG